VQTTVVIITLSLKLVSGGESGIGVLQIQMALAQKKCCNMLLLELFSLFCVQRKTIIFHGLQGKKAGPETFK